MRVRISGVDDGDRSRLGQTQENIIRLDVSDDAGRLVVVIDDVSDEEDKELVFTMCDQSGKEYSVRVCESGLMIEREAEKGARLYRHVE